MSGPHVKLYSEKHGDQIVYEGIAGQPMFEYLAEHGPTWGVAESDILRQTGTFRRRADGSWYDIDLDPGGASGYGAAWLNRDADRQWSTEEQRWIYPGERAELVAKIRAAIRAELLEQFEGPGWIDKDALNEGEPWIQIDGTVDIQEMAEAIAAGLGG